MFGSPSKKVQAVQVLDTRPMTKLQYYAKSFGTTAIVFLALSIVAIILGALILGGVIHAKGYTDEIGAFSSFVSLANTPTPLIDDSFGQISHSEIVELINKFIEANPTWESISHKQDVVMSWGNGFVFFGSIIAVLSTLGVATCAFLGRLDVKFNKKQEQRHLDKLLKAEYKTAKRVTAYQNAKKAKEGFKKLKADYKAKKK